MNKKITIKKLEEMRKKIMDGLPSPTHFEKFTRGTLSVADRKRYIYPFKEMYKTMIVSFIQHDGAISKEEINAGLKNLLRQYINNMALSICASTGKIPANQNALLAAVMPDINRRIEELWAAGDALFASDQSAEEKQPVILAGRVIRSVIARLTDITPHSARGHASLLSLAVISGRPDVLEWLLEQGASANAVINPADVSPLQMIAATLREMFATKTFTANDHNLIQIFLRFTNNMKTCAGLLLRHGADPGLMDGDRTLLVDLISLCLSLDRKYQLQATFQDIILDYIEYLLNPAIEDGQFKKIDPSACVTSSTVTAGVFLPVYARKIFIEKVREKNGGQVPDLIAGSPLFLSISAQNERLTRMLLDAGADAHSRTAGIRMDELATLTGDEKMIALVEEHMRKNLPSPTTGKSQEQSILFRYKEAEIFYYYQDLHNLVTQMEDFDQVGNVDGVQEILAVIKQKTKARPEQILPDIQTLQRAVFGCGVDEAAVDAYFEKGYFFLIPVSADREDGAAEEFAKEVFRAVEKTKSDAEKNALRVFYGRTWHRCESMGEAFVAWQYETCREVFRQINETARDFPDILSQSFSFYTHYQCLSENADYYTVSEADIANKALRLCREWVGERQAAEEKKREEDLFTSLINEREAVLLRFMKKLTQSMTLSPLHSLSLVNALLMQVLPPVQLRLNEEGVFSLPVLDKELLSTVSADEMKSFNNRYWKYIRLLKTAAPCFSLLTDIDPAVKWRPEVVDGARFVFKTENGPLADDIKKAIKDASTQAQDAFQPVFKAGEDYSEVTFSALVKKMRSGPRQAVSSFTFFPPALNEQKNESSLLIKGPKVKTKGVPGFVSVATANKKSCIQFYFQSDNQEFLSLCRFSPEEKMEMNALPSDIEIFKMTAKYCDRPSYAAISPAVLAELDGGLQRELREYIQHHLIGDHKRLKIIRPEESDIYGDDGALKVRFDGGKLRACLVEVPADCLLTDGPVPENACVLLCLKIGPKHKKMASTGDIVPPPADLIKPQPEKNAQTRAKMGW